MILAALRGFLIGRLTSGNTTGVEAGFEALARALDREEAALWGSITVSWSLTCGVAVGRQRSCRLLALID
jgi:hypothetical protein